ncbi:MAG: adenosylcobinamide-GDP ribazoletransferase [Methanomassiliicoccales archaeon]|nr:adenosylcobinamide-GDP ribazoletransferase [Methanomassiliicoccales archaeon]
MEGKDVEDLSHNFHLILFVGLFYGLIAGAIMYVGDDWLSRLVTAAIALAALHLLNRFLHLDGLSDLGDGLVCGGNAERKMAAMKDSNTGAGGLGYVMVFGLLSFAALGSLWGAALFFLPLMAEIMNKNAMVMCAFRGKAREGLGNMFIANTGALQAGVSLLLSVLLSLGMFILFDGLISDPLGTGRIFALVIVGALVSSLVGLGMSRLAKRNFGAVNGDVLGATNEICRPLVLIAMLLVIA